MRKQVTIYFNMNNEQEEKLYNWLNGKYAKNAVVKELIEEAMLREESPINKTSNINNDSNKEDELLNKNKEDREITITIDDDLMDL